MRPGAPRINKRFVGDITTWVVMSCHHGCTASYEEMEAAIAAGRSMMKRAVRSLSLLLVVTFTLGPLVGTPADAQKCSHVFTHRHSRARETWFFRTRRCISMPLPLPH